MKNILVTGGAGFIGSNFVRWVLSQHTRLRIVNLDALTYAGSRENLRELPHADRHHFLEGDICDRRLVHQVLQQYEIDTVVHFAAETHVDRSITGPEPFVRSNVVGTMTLLEAARERWVSSDGDQDGHFRFHHISTDEVYGSLALDAPAWTEESAYSPNSPYAASKAASDHLVRSFGHTYGLPYTITISSNNYGPRQHPEKLIPLMIHNALRGKPLPVYGDGQQIRDWLHVDDHCRAIWKVIGEGKTGETYHVGGGVQIKNLNVVTRICDLIDKIHPDSPHSPRRDLIELVEDRPGHDRRYDLNTDKIRHHVGWEPTISFQEGLEETVGWYVDHPDWIEKVKKGEN